MAVPGLPLLSGMLPPIYTSTTYTRDGSYLHVMNNNYSFEYLLYGGHMHGNANGGINMIFPWGHVGTLSHIATRSSTLVMQFIYIIIILY